MIKLTEPQWHDASSPNFLGRPGDEDGGGSCCLLISSIISSVASAEFLSRRWRREFMPRPGPGLSHMLAPPSLVSSIHIWTLSRSGPVLVPVLVMVSIPVANSHSSGSTLAM